MIIYKLMIVSTVGLMGGCYEPPVQMPERMPKENKCLKYFSSLARNQNIIHLLKEDKHATLGTLHGLNYAEEYTQWKKWM